MKRLLNDKGSTLVASLIMITLLGYMGASVVELTSSDAVTGVNEIQSVQASQVGNGGIQYALDKLNNGESPAVTDKAFGPGTFSITTDPTTQAVNVTGKVGLAKKTQSVTTNFSQQCTDIDVTPATYNNFDLKGIEISKSCNDDAIVDSMVLEWNWSLCAQNLSCTATENPEPGDDPNEGKITICHIPPGNPANAHTISVSVNALPAHTDHGDTIGECAAGDPATPVVCEGYDDQITACGANTGGALVKSIRLNGSLVANNVNADSGIVIDVNDTLTLNQAYLLDEITFDEKIPDEVWFAITVNYADGSSVRKPFKFASPVVAEEEGAAFTTDAGQLTVNPDHTVSLQVLGSSITCGAGGATIPVKVDLATNGVYHNLFNNQAVAGGETHTVTTASGDTFKLRGNGKLNTCGNFNKSYESTNTAQVKTLKNGDQAPALAGFGGQKPVQAFLAPYLDGTGKLVLAENQVIMLFEIGTTNLDSSAADFQDLVVLFTIE